MLTILLLCTLDVSSSTHLDLGSYYRQSLENWASCSNRLTSFPLPWLCIIADVRRFPAEALPAAQHPNQHREMFQKKKCKERHSMSRGAAAGCLPLGWRPCWIFLFCFLSVIVSVCVSDMLDENQSKLSEDLMEFRRDASMLNVSAHTPLRGISVKQ